MDDFIPRWAEMDTLARKVLMNEYERENLPLAKWHVEAVLDSRDELGESPLR